MISKAKKKSSESAEFDLASATSGTNPEVQKTSAGDANAKAQAISAGENRTAVKATSASGRSTSGIGTPSAECDIV